MTLFMDSMRAAHSKCESDKLRSLLATCMLGGSLFLDATPVLELRV